MKKPIIEPEKDYTFHDYFRMRASTEDILEYFGYKRVLGRIELPRTVRELPSLERLFATLEDATSKDQPTSRCKMYCFEQSLLPRGDGRQGQGGGLAEGERGGLAAHDALVDQVQFAELVPGRLMSPAYQTSSPGRTMSPVHRPRRRAGRVKSEDARLLGVSAPPDLVVDRVDRYCADSTRMSCPMAEGRGTRCRCGPRDHRVEAALEHDCPHERSAGIAFAGLSGHPTSVAAPPGVRQGHLVPIGTIAGDRTGCPTTATGTMCTRPCARAGTPRPAREQVVRSGDRGARRRPGSLRRTEADPGRRQPEGPPARSNGSRSTISSRAPCSRRSHRAWSTR